jgi:hypothetical protein
MISSKMIKQKKRPLKSRSNTFFRLSDFQGNSQPVISAKIEANLVPKFFDLSRELKPALEAGNQLWYEV